MKHARGRHPLCLIASVILIALLVVTVVGCGGTSPGKPKTQGDKIFQQANKTYDQMNYTEAAQLYEEALPVLKSEGNQEDADACLMQLYNSQLYPIVYPYTEAEIRQQLDEKYPQVSQEVKDGWISSGEMETWTVDGETCYFSQAVDNIEYRHIDVMRQDTAKMASYDSLFPRFITNVIPAGDVQPYQPYVNPVTYEGTQTLNVPRAELPESGTLQLWWPLPLNYGPQTGVTLTSVNAAGYMQLPVSTAQDLGMAYMEIPLDQLQQDLAITLKFDFTRYEQRFRVDPANIGTYDTSDSEYREYTASSGNIEITPEIARTAQQVVGGETNPYKQARLLYDYVINNINYSFMPHMVLWPRGQAESVYVQKYRRGDCGAQSIYFSAMCRSLGIPARATGGFQLFSGDFGSHFWAEFYLPNYGWIPVDTSAAQIALFPTNLTQEQRQAFLDFFFANMDSMRCVVQKNVDEVFIPAAATDTQVAMPMAVQMVEAECETMTVMPDLVLGDGYQIHAKQL